VGRITGLADWDWWSNKHSLDPEDKVEGTSSLKMYDAEGCLSRMDGTLLVLNGAVETYWKFLDTDISFRFIFRNGVDVGEYALRDCYLLEADFSYDLKVSLSKFIGATEYNVSIGDAKGLPVNTWMKMRAVGYEKGGKIYAYIERFTTDWEKVTDVVFDEEPMWRDRTINRMGIGHLGKGVSKWDSTTLYTVTP